MNKLNLLAVAVCGAALSFSANAQSISKVNGNINVAAGQSVEDISIVNGTVSVAENATVRDEISVVNGQISVKSGSKVGEISAVNGDVDLGDKVSTGELTTVNGGITLGRGVRASNDVTSVNGDILANAGTAISGDVMSVNGAIGLIATQVTGSVEGLNGNLTVGSHSSVGAVRYKKSKGISIGFRERRIPLVIIGPNATVRGDLVFEREVKLYVHSSAKVGKITGATAIPYSGTQAPKN